MEQLNRAAQYTALRLKSEQLRECGLHSRAKQYIE